MGAWSHEPFGNDTAGDWAYGLDGTSDFSLVRQALSQVLDNEDDYLDADVGMEAVAAAEVLAKARGKGTQADAYTESVDAWLAGLGAPPPPELFALATRALERIQAEESELRELWEDSDDFAAWKASMTTLQAAMAP